jgi:hypothetical protein
MQIVPEIYSRCGKKMPYLYVFRTSWSKVGAKVKISSAYPGRVPVWRNTDKDIPEPP